MDESNEHTSLVRSNGALNGANQNSTNNGYNTRNGHHHCNSHNQPRTRAATGDGFVRRDPRTLLTQVQRSLAFFQDWAADFLHGKEDSAIVSWVQSARVAKTFMMIINVLLAISAFVLIGVESLEMVLREPILDYLLPESEITFLAAGLTIVACAFGLAVGYNLLVEEDTPGKKDDGDGQQDRGNSGQNGRDPEPPSPPHPTSRMVGQSSNPALIAQRTIARPRIMFTKASVNLLLGYVVLMTVLLVVFTITIVQRSNHLSKSNDEIFNAWGVAFKQRTLIGDFQLRHHCCGFNNVRDRSYPPYHQNPDPGDPANLPCPINPRFEFQEPCKDLLTKDFWRWQNGIQHLLLVQLTMLVSLLLLAMGLSGIGLSELKERKHQDLEDTEAQRQGTNSTPTGAARREEYASERPLLLENESSRSGNGSLLIDIASEPSRTPVEQDTLI
ncbi:hypothetical protein EMPS_07389 [Entomortierella parvispora]|uniref:Uncharacterized protein n=1 Tax=Entomortierella parvispora TaxID=205924 RepID=A0A9P3HEC9_9FUNG|nr:hypothetical protein EMPS_07389 [Entomortierella parvispora]